jgi:hypothetical protein
MYDADPKPDSLSSVALQGITAGQFVHDPGIDSMRQKMLIDSE